MPLVSCPARKFSTARSLFSLPALLSQLVRRLKEPPTVKPVVKDLDAVLLDVAVDAVAVVLVALDVAAEPYVEPSCLYALTT